MYGRLGNLITYYFDIVTLYINRKQEKDGQKASSNASQRKVNSESLRTTEALLTFIEVVYNFPLRIHIELEIETIYRKLKMVFGENDLQHRRF